MTEPRIDPETGRHIFAKRPTRAKTVENIAFWLFRIATYFVVICAAYLFGDIIIKGSMTVFPGVWGEGPIVNTKFLTESPQTLRVFEDRDLLREYQKVNREIISLKGEVKRHNDSEVEAIKTIQNDIAQKEVLLKQLKEQREEKRLLYDDKEFRALPSSELPDMSVYREETYSYSGGGIWPAIVGTVLLVTGSTVIALVLGILCAIYLSEYSRPGRLLDAIRLSILNLAGVPSIVFGIFGFGMFVLTFGWGTSMVAGWFTLAFMALPLVIASCEESLRAIPKGFREGSLALGATKWTSIRTNVIPYAMPGIMTSCIMSIARVAGETAPIMFTAAFAIRDNLPWEGLTVEHWWNYPGEFISQGVMALPYHIYVVSSKIPQNEYTSSMQYGTAFVFLLIVGSLALTSIILRIRMRAKYRW